MRRSSPKNHAVVTATQTRNEMKYTLICFLVAVGGTMALGAAPKATDTCECPCQPATPDENLKTVVEYYKRVINESNFEGLEKYVGSYIQHNPGGTDGLDGVLKYMKPIIEAGGSKGTLRIARTIAQGDYVWTHSQASLGGKKHVLVGIFRMECGKIAEHWDAVQEMVPSAINDHAYF